MLCSASGLLVCPQPTLMLPIPRVVVTYWIYSTWLVLYHFCNALQSAFLRFVHSFLHHRILGYFKIYLYFQNKHWGPVSLFSFLF